MRKFKVVLTPVSVVGVVEAIHQLGEVEKRAAQAVDHVDDHDVDLAWSPDHSPGARFRCGVAELEYHGSYGH